MATFKTPSLDPATGRLRTKHVPLELTSGPLNTTIAGQVSTAGAAARVALDSVFAHPKAFAALKQSLAAGRTCALGISGDSTGNETGFTAEWVSLFAQAIATRYPAYTVSHRIWDDTTQAFGAPILEQTGASGVRSVRVTKTLLVDAAAVKHIAGDIDVRVKVALDDWTPTAQNTLVGRFGASGARAWRMYVNTNGFLYFEWSADGTTLITKNSGVVVGAADGSVKWVRATLDVDNGASGNEVKFYTSDDGAVWTQLGSTVTTAGVTSLFEPTAQPWEFGGYAISSFITVGQLHEVQIRDGIAGPIVNPIMPDLWQVRDDTSYTFSGSPVLTIVNGSHPGANLGYLNDATRLPKLHPDYGQVSIMFSDSHNENWGIGEAWRIKYEAWLNAVQTLRPLASLVLCTQNHRKSPALNIGAHVERQQIIRAVAARRGHGLIDAFKAFNGDDTLVQSDGIHPTKGSGATGSQVWANAAITLFDASA